MDDTAVAGLRPANNDLSGWLQLRRLPPWRCRSLAEEESWGRELNPHTDLNPESRYRINVRILGKTGVETWPKGSMLMFYDSVTC